MWGGVVDNKIQQLGNYIIYDNSNLNSGTYIGYVKQIKLVLLNILQQTHSLDDQVELIKYAKRNPNYIHIDSNNDFFYVISKPLQQINLNDNKRCNFIHANGNGCLEDFLLEHHKIYVDVNTKLVNYIIHSNTIIK